MMETAVLRKRQEREDAIPSDWKLDPAITMSFKTPLESSTNNMLDSKTVQKSQILSDKELFITESCHMTRILGALASGEFTALEVTTAFCKRAAIAHQLTNCLTEIMFDTALERAKELDRLKREGKHCGPLHGLPVSLKDSFQIAGVGSTLGLAAYVDHKSSTTTPIVTMLLDLGAVLYCKTNVPQLLMAGESNNNVFGRTLNPYNTSLTSGGSSGGEGALLAMRGAPMGVGTDVAGSIRIPALCCGTYGFRPTAQRLPFSGLQACYDASLPIINPSVGPLANDVDSLATFAKAIIDARPALYDSEVLDVGWRDVQGGAGLRIGVLVEDPVYPLHPPIRHTLAEASRCLESNGHELIQLGPDDCHLAALCQIASAMFGLDKVAPTFLAAGGEQPVACLSRVMEELAKVPRDAVSDLDDCSDLEKLSGLHKKREWYAARWGELWKKHRLDAVIAPVAQSTAVQHDKFGPLPYTGFLNLLDYPACAIPFGKAEGSRLDGSVELKPDQAAPPYDAASISGAPCGIQVFTPKMRDEECLAIAKVIDGCLNKKVDSEMK